MTITYTINGKKASKLWGGILPGYNVTQEEIDSVIDNNGDTILHIYDYGDGLIEITNVEKVESNNYYIDEEGVRHDFIYDSRLGYDVEWLS